MKNILYTLALAALFTACEKTTVVPDASGGKDTTVVVPVAEAEKKTENNTTIINPVAPAAEKTESSTTTVNTPGSSTETKSETTTTP